MKLPGKPRNTLSQKDIIFIDKYVETMSPEAAYKASHPNYKGKWAKRLGWQELQRGPIRSAIEVRRMQVSAELNVTPAEVIKRMMFIGYCDPQDFTDPEGHWLGIRQIPKEARLAISKIKVMKEDVEVERITTVEGKATVETVTTTHYRVLEYGMWDKVKMLNSLADHLNLFGGGRPKSPIEDLSIEELERLTAASEEAVRAIEGIAEKSRKSVMEAARKTATLEMAEPAKPAAGKKTKGNGKTNGGHS